MEKQQHDYLISRFEAELGKVQRPGMDRLLEYIRKSDFYTAPASRNFTFPARADCCITV